MGAGIETRRWSELWLRIRETAGGSVLLLGVTVGIPWALMEALRATLTLPGAGPA